MSAEDGMRSGIALWLAVLAGCASAPRVDDGGTDGGGCGSCAANEVCVVDRCETSRCGDAVVDRAGGEDCEDGNEVAFDGCTACRFDCAANAQCDDGDECSGTEHCDIETHRC